MQITTLDQAPTFLRTGLGRLTLGLIALSLFAVPYAPMEGDAALARVAFACIAFFAAAAIIQRDDAGASA